MYCPNYSDVLSELFRCTVRKIQMYCQKDSDVLSELFRCTVRKIQMYCLKDSNVLSERFRCTVRKIQMYCLNYSDVLSERFRFIVRKNLCFSRCIRLFMSIKCGQISFIRGHFCNGYGNATFLLINRDVLKKTVVSPVRWKKE